MFIQNFDYKIYLTPIKQNETIETNMNQKGSKRFEKVRKSSIAIMVSHSNIQITCYKIQGISHIIYKRHT